MQHIEHIKVVLVNPQNGRNVGAVCRAMKNMGLLHLVIVGGTGLKLQDAKNLAIHAGDVLENARYFSSLEAALADVSLAAGVTRRRGKRRKYFSILPEELARRITHNGSAAEALVFGNEESGLTDSELALCNLAVRIPSSSLFPSLNLSHAVQIVCYAIYREITHAASSARIGKPDTAEQLDAAPALLSKGYSPIKGKRVDLLVEVAVQSLANVGFFTQVGSGDMRIFLRDILARAQLSSREAKRVELLFRKISGLAAGKGVVV